MTHHLFGSHHSGAHWWEIDVASTHPHSPPPSPLLSALSFFPPQGREETDFLYILHVLVYLLFFFFGQMYYFPALPLASLPSHYSGTGESIANELVATIIKLCAERSASAGRRSPGYSYTAPLCGASRQCSQNCRIALPPPLQKKMS